MKRKNKNKYILCPLISLKFLLKMFWPMYLNNATQDFYAHSYTGERQLDHFLLPQIKDV